MLKAKYNKEIRLSSSSLGKYNNRSISSSSSSCDCWENSTRKRRKEKLISRCYPLKNLQQQILPKSLY